MLKVKSHLAPVGLTQEVMDKAPTHPSLELKSDDGKIMAFFHRMNESMKWCYRKTYMQNCRRVLEISQYQACNF